VKKYLVLFALLLITSSAFAQTAAPAVKIGYVDSETILAQYSEAIKAKSDIDGLVAKWKAQIDSMAAELQASYGEYQKQAATMSPEKQKEQQTKIVEKEQKAQQFRDQKFNQPNGEYFVRQEQIMAPVKTKIFNAINDIAKDESMQFVFDKAGDVILLYADQQFDITFKVLDRLKRGK